MRTLWSRLGGLFQRRALDARSCQCRSARSPTSALSMRISPARSVSRFSAGRCVPAVRTTAEVTTGVTANQFVDAGV
jgi:hypothetical protein